MLQLPVYMHHGIQDCVSLGDGSCIVCRRKQKFSPETVLEAKERLLDEMQEKQLTARCKEAAFDINELVKRIQTLCKSGDRPGMYGNRDFYLGMCERMLFSSLVDADFRDAADFMDAVPTYTGEWIEISRWPESANSKPCIPR